MKFEHMPVMLRECIEGLDIKPDGVYFDGTLGGGGHSSEILKRLMSGRLIATDLDTEAIAAATERLGVGERFLPIHDNFKNFKSIIAEQGITKVDGVLLDLGVSSYQLDERERGFSYMGDSALDMRMDRDGGFSAYDVVNGYSAGELKRILTDYGEERFAANIAKNIVAARESQPIATTSQLCEIIERSIPAKFKHEGHPARRTFQAIRIEVNGELDGLGQAVKDMIGGLKKGGRIVVLTFHSLEDRIVKRAFKDMESDCECDKRLPVCVCGKKREIEILTRKPITAGEDELSVNSRAKCAKLRIAEKIID